MRKILNSTLKILLTYFICITLGFALLFVAFTFPNSRIETNIKESIDIFSTEKTYPIIEFFGNKTKLDNFTDSLMLMNAGYDSENNLIKDVINIYRPYEQNKFPAETIVNFYDSDYSGEITEISYGRYWHGYLIFLKPLLCIFNYGQIRIINAVFIVLTTAFMIVLMFKRKFGKFIIPYLLCLMITDPIAISKSIQFSSIYYIYTIAVIILLLKKELLDKNTLSISLFFFVIGCATSYFDLLTAPIITFGIPFIMWLCLNNKKFPDIFREAICCGSGWVSGYVTMWAGKLVIGTLFGGENLIENGFLRLLLHSSIKESDGVVSYFGVIKSQIYTALSPYLLMAVIYLIFAVLLLFIIKSKNNLNDFKWVLFILVSFLPFIWYFVAVRHSYIHYWFTYREVVVTVFALLCGVTDLINISPKINTNIENNYNIKEKKKWIR